MYTYETFGGNIQYFSFYDFKLVAVVFSFHLNIQTTTKCFKA